MDKDGIVYNVNLEDDGTLDLNMGGADNIPVFSDSFFRHYHTKVGNDPNSLYYNKSIYSYSLMDVVDMQNIGIVVEKSTMDGFFILYKRTTLHNSSTDAGAFFISQDTFSLYYEYLKKLFGYVVDQEHNTLTICGQKSGKEPFYAGLKLLIIGHNYDILPPKESTFPSSKLVRILTPVQEDYTSFNNYNYCTLQIDEENPYNDPEDGIFTKSYGGGIFESFLSFFKSESDYSIYFNSENRLSIRNASKTYLPNSDANNAQLIALQKTTNSIWDQNKDAGCKMQTYIDEAFYFMPMVIAGALQQTGDYQLALDWYKTIYNYTVNAPSRIIYYGLQAYRNQTTLYTKSDIYLTDSLNPHSIAVTRPDSYLRYTVSSIVNCIIQYGDSEFTKDTAESVSNADRLYNEAIGLLDTFKYNSPVSACDNILDGLTVVITDPNWLPLWNNLQEEILMVETYSDLSDLVNEINDIFNLAGKTYAQKFTLAQNRIYTKLQLQEGILSLNEMQQQTEYMVMAAETNTFSTLTGTSSNPVNCFGVGSNVQTPMLYTATSLMNKTTGNFVLSAAAAGGIDSSDVLSMGKSIVGMNNTFPDIPSGNVVVNQSFDVSMDNVRGDYSVSPSLTSSAIPSEYDTAGPARAQIGFQITASQPNAIYVSNKGIASYNSPVSILPGGNTTVIQNGFNAGNTQQNKTEQIISYQVTYYKPYTILNYCIPKNPILQMLRFMAELNLFKIRNCRDISGAVRDLAPFSVPTDATSGLPVALNGSINSASSSSLSNLKSTEFRYSFLIDRAKQLCNIAQQMESSLLSMYEKVDAESYTLLKAKQDVALTKQQVQLQNLQLKAANDQVKVAQFGVTRANYQQQYYQDLLSSGIVEMQLQALDLSEQAFGFMMDASIFSFSGSVAAAADFTSPEQSFNALSKGFELIGQFLQGQATSLQSFATFDLEISNWNFQAGLAGIDLSQAQAQVTVAQDQVDVTSQQLNIAQLQSQFADDTVNFLQDKFTNVALYSFMSKQISAVYKYFLSQATATARMAAVQLSFERQIDFSNVIGSDYYSDPQTGQGSDPNQSQYRGLTGSARLLKDIYILDNDSVNTDIRKLQLSKTISLKDLDPVNFMNFVNTGILSFTTTHDMFDSDFPGQYLRLINSVNVSVIALVPPVTGIRASLRNLGQSRVIIGGDFPQEVSINRQPDMIAFTSPTNATGTFDLQQLNPELYKPFENCGVAMNWVFEMPQYSNRMDFSSIADVQLTINYTALYSDTLRSQVLKKLGNTMSARRAFSVQLFYPDAWYDLFNPDPNASNRTFSFTITEDNFPINISNIQMADITMYFSINPQPDPNNPAVVGVYSLSLTRSDGSIVVSSNVPDNPNSPVTPVKSINNMIASKFRSGLDWQIFSGGSPLGKWDVAIDNSAGSGGINDLISNGQLKDIIFIIDYTADLPPYNAF